MQSLGDEEEFSYPFQGSKHLDPVGINHDQVVMSKRTLTDFESMYSIG